MRTKKCENFIEKLMKTKDIIDVAELEKYIRNVVGYDKSSLEKECFRIKELIENQYEKYGIIDENDNIEAFRRGYYELNKLSVTLDDIRYKIESLGYEKESGLGIRIQQDWNYAPHLLVDLLYLENINLHNYSCLLATCLGRIVNFAMYSCYSEKNLKLVYDYLCSESLFCNKDEFSEFFKIFKAAGSDVTHKIKVNTSKTGAKALLRVVVEELTKKFPASLVNLFFADKDGGDLNMASHHRPTAYGDYQREISRLLSLE